MENTRVRYAVIGAGNIAQVAVLPAFAHAKENCELAAIISSDATKREELMRMYDVEHAGTYPDLEDILASADIDAVYISLPNDMHREYTERCAAAGVHVLCEKPMAMTSEDCRAMINACDENGVKLMIAYRLHFEETNLRAIEIVKSGALGNPRYFSSVFSHSVRPGDIRTKGELGGGALYDLGTYCVNAARYLFQDEPVEVLGWRVIGTDERFKDVDEMTGAMLRFPGERIAQFTVNQGAGDVSALRVVGTEGDLRLEPAFEYSTGLKQYITIDGKTDERTFGKRDQFAPELVYFSECILNDTEPEPSGEEGLADVRVLEAIVESSQTGKPVKLAPFSRAKRPSMDQNIKKRPVKEPKTVNAPSPSR